LKNLSERIPELKSCSPGEFYALGIWTTAYRKMLSAAFIESHTDLNTVLTDTGDLIPTLEAVTQTYPPATHYASESVPELSRLSEKDRNILIENDLILNFCQINPAAEYLNRVFLLPPNDEQSSSDILSLLDQVKFQGQSLKQWLMKPLQAHPDSLMHQLEYMRDHWEPFLGSWLNELLQGIDILAEENRVRSPAPGPVNVPEYSESSDPEYSPDRDWMPNVVMIAKNALVWLDQLSREFGRDISRLDQIPDEALDQLQERGFTALWLIGIWERSQVSRTIKQWTGQPDAEASAYSLKRYQVADQIGGPAALENLRGRAWQRGIRLASDMVPNHTGLDSDWMMEHPDYFISAPEPPFHSYSYRSENLSPDPRVSLHLEDHYFDHSDAAVTFKAVYHERGETRYIYHGNDGTSMPWNDTAQLDYLNPEVREAVIQTIIHVARQTPIIRFDAAMTLARKHIRRLWYPRPGEGGAIPSRALASLSDEEFNRRLPVEFWREVVNRVSEEAPDTLLLAEAFWMMEGYFVRTLGMHRVYNSAFMNMLKMEDNASYRQLIKNTLEYDPQILKRYVNFLNNPDEETAVVQFGDGDKYFAVTTLMVTLPGLPLFGHGQWEGFHEKYGMEFRRAQWREHPNHDLLCRHADQITPLLKKRWLFARVDHFILFDFFVHNGRVNENVFIYVNRIEQERTLVAVNNSYERTAGWIHRSAAFRDIRTDALNQIHLHEALNLPEDDSGYLCFQEQRSGLWFLRSIPQIRAEGLFFQLQGYEAQVYWNF
ncbi:MAG: alpha-amylase, partial [FCB group bacterium]|nr:alpha-amylase [FCB group bacterium]